MLCKPLLIQTIKSNKILFLVFTLVMSVLLIQFSSLEMTKSLLFTIFYGMMAMILPGIYILIVSNNLVCQQVDRGSMAYILATPKSRKQIVFTQGFFLIVSVILMFVIETIIHLVVNKVSPLLLSSASLGDGYLKSSSIILINLSAMGTVFLISGIAFMFSCIFNLSKNTYQVNGTIIGVSILANMMAMFGTLGIKALANFKYLSLCSLYDYNGILNNDFLWIVKFLVAIIVGIATYAIGCIYFSKKDLPL